MFAEIRFAGGSFFIIHYIVFVLFIIDRLTDLLNECEVALVTTLCSMMNPEPILLELSIQTTAYNSPCRMQNKHLLATTSS